MADKTYTVVALCVIPTVDSGISALVERGGVVPSNATKEWLDHALANNLIEEGALQAGLVVYAGDGSELAPVADLGAVEPKSPEGPALDDDGNPKEPSKSGSKGDWVAFATFKAGGDTEKLAAIEGMTRDDLAATYGTQAAT